MANITEIKFLGIFDYEDNGLNYVMQTIDDIINQPFNVEIIPKGAGNTFFRIILNGEFNSYTIRTILNNINSYIGNTDTEGIQVVVSTANTMQKFDLDGQHDIIL